MFSEIFCKNLAFRTNQGQILNGTFSKIKEVKAMKLFIFASNLLA